MSASIAYRVLFVIPNAPLVIPSAVEESLPHRPEGRALRPFIWERGGAGSSSAPTLSSIPVTIGESVITKFKPGSKERIAGAVSPMYGIIKDLDAHNSPDITMNHLAAVIALKVVNQGDGTSQKINSDAGRESITISSLNFGVPSFTVYGYNEDGTQYVKSNQTAVQIVGGFVVDITSEGTGGKLCPTYTVSGDASHSVSLALESPLTIEPGKSETFYIAVRPFDKSCSTFTGSEPLEGLTLEVGINGDSRKVEIPSDLTFEAGKVTTLRVPVKASYPINSHSAFSIRSVGRYKDDKPERILSISGEKIDSTVVANVNGLQTKIYTIGGEKKLGLLKISGFAKEMVNALPLGFYASQYNNTPTAMTVHSLRVDLPNYEERSVTIPFVGKFGYTVYYNLKGRTPIEDKFGGLAGLLGWDFSEGISRSLIVGTLGISPITITFNGLMPVGNFNDNNIIIMDEAPIYKEISIAAVESYMKKIGSDATVEGLKQILNAEFTNENDLDENDCRYIKWTSAAEKTGQAIYNKIKSIISSRAGNSDYLAEKALELLGFDDYEELMYKMRDMRFEITLATYPYASDYSKYIDQDPDVDLQPISFWGFDAYGPNN